MRKAKTIWINNATTEFVEKVNDTFSEDAEVRVLPFPGQNKTVDKNVQFKEADVKIVCLIRNKEVPSMSITLDESRTSFWALKETVHTRRLLSKSQSTLPASPSPRRQPRLPTGL